MTSELNLDGNPGQVPLSWWTMGLRTLKNWTPGLKSKRLISILSLRSTGELMENQSLVQSLLPVFVRYVNIPGNSKFFIKGVHKKVTVISGRYWGYVVSTLIPSVPSLINTSQCV